MKQDCHSHQHAVGDGGYNDGEGGNEDEGGGRVFAGESNLNWLRCLS